MVSLTCVERDVTRNPFVVSCNCKQGCDNFVALLMHELQTEKIVSLDKSNPSFVVVVVVVFQPILPRCSFSSYIGVHDPTPNDMETSTRLIAVLTE